MRYQKDRDGRRDSPVRSFYEDDRSSYCKKITEYRYHGILVPAMERIFRMTRDSCHMRERMLMMDTEIDENTGLPKDQSYLEAGLPDTMKEAIGRLQKSWEVKDSGKMSLDWDNDWCELYSRINVAEVSGQISHRAANYLREKYLRLEV